MLSKADVEKHLNSIDFDIRKSNYGRWIDQKCTPDVVWSVADFVMDYVINNGEDAEFTVRDIWNSDYAKDMVASEFTKPDTDSKKADNEFDKFFSQQLNLLCYSQIIEDVSSTSRHLYKVSNMDLLEYVSRNDTYTYEFICMYVEKVLKDSGLWNDFEDFFKNQTKDGYKKLKDAFEQFCYDNTKIRNKKETGRIFTKVINPLACKYKKKGTERGRISKNIIPKSDLMYNRNNFRDVYTSKPKNVTRTEWLENNPQIKPNLGYTEHQMQAAKRTLRIFNDKYRGGKSEFTQFNATENDNASATQMHHIFPKADFPQIMAYLENLIALTPNQHFGYAHPNNNTQYIDFAAQKVLLICKTCSVEENLKSSTEEHIYTFDNLLFVISEGWSDPNILSIADGDYKDIINSINAHYI